MAVPVRFSSSDSRRRAQRPDAPAGRELRAERVADRKPQRLRDWNLQLRQPILLFDGRNTVSVSPQEGFLHQVSELDTLGLDRPETKCKLK